MGVNNIRLQSAQGLDQLGYRPEVLERLYVATQVLDEMDGDSIILGDIEHSPFDARLGPGQQCHLVAPPEQTTTSEQNVLLSTADDQAGYEMDYSHAPDFTTESQPEEVQLVPITARGKGRKL